MAGTESAEHRGPVFRPIRTRGNSHWDRRHSTPWELMQKQRRQHRRKSKAMRQALRTEVFSKIIL